MNDIMNNHMNNKYHFLFITGHANAAYVLHSYLLKHIAFCCNVVHSCGTMELRAFGYRSDGPVFEPDTRHTLRSVCSSTQMCLICFRGCSLVYVINKVHSINIL